MAQRCLQQVGCRKELGWLLLGIPLCRVLEEWREQEAPAYPMHRLLELALVKVEMKTVVEVQDRRAGGCSKEEGGQPCCRGLKSKSSKAEQDATTVGRRGILPETVDSLGSQNAATPAREIICRDPAQVEGSNNILEAQAESQAEEEIQVEEIHRNHPT